MLIGQSPVLVGLILVGPVLGNPGLENLVLHPRACADFEVSQGLGQVPCRNTECMQGVFDISVELIFWSDDSSFGDFPRDGLDAGNGS